MYVSISFSLSVSLSLCLSLSLSTSFSFFFLSFQTGHCSLTYFKYHKSCLFRLLLGRMDVRSCTCRRAVGGHSRLRCQPSSINAYRRSVANLLTLYSLILFLALYPSPWFCSHLSLTLYISLFHSLYHYHSFSVSLSLYLSLSLSLSLSSYKHSVYICPLLTTFLFACLQPGSSVILTESYPVE